MTFRFLSLSLSLSLSVSRSLALLDCSDYRNRSSIELLQRSVTRKRAA